MTTIIMIIVAVVALGIGFGTWLKSKNEDNNSPRPSDGFPVGDDQGESNPIDKN